MVAASLVARRSIGANSHGTSLYSPCGIGATMYGPSTAVDPDDVLPPTSARQVNRLDVSSQLRVPLFSLSRPFKTKPRILRAGSKFVSCSRADLSEIAASGKRRLES